MEGSGEESAGGAGPTRYAWYSPSRRIVNASLQNWEDVTAGERFCGGESLDPRPSRDPQNRPPNCQNSVTLRTRGRAATNTHTHEAEQPSHLSPASGAKHACPIENSVNRNFSPIYRK